MNCRHGFITKSIGAGEFTVACGDDLYICTARGVFRNKKVTPVVGDHVIIDINKKSIDTLKPRKNELRRPPVANIDQVIITVAAVEPAFHAGLLDRFLVIAEHEGIDIAICVNKFDLYKGAGTVFMPYKAHYPMIFASTVTGCGLDDLRGIMAGKLNVFAGPSGVGKSSLINAVVPGASMETGDISERLKRGKHTTRHAEILKTATGYCVDTPGFSSLEVEGIPARDIAGLFPEFLPYTGQCKFNDCMHERERDCAVKAQVGEMISPARYESYCKFITKTT